MSNFTISRGSTTLEFDASMLPISITRNRKQNVLESETGKISVYDRGGGVTVNYIALKISTERSNSNYADIGDINSFIENEAVFQLNTFTLTPPSNIDLGDGDGVAVTVRYFSPELIESQDRVQIYNYDFLFRIEI